MVGEIDFAQVSELRIETDLYREIVQSHDIQEMFMKNACDNS